jgi:transcriptional regulator GlxA family with amidase domain
MVALTPTPVNVAASRKFDISGHGPRSLVPVRTTRGGIASIHLATEGTTFRLLIDEVRSILAEEMLSHRMRVAEVAERLGYAEAASFSHAFKRWKGTPPGVYRARA